MSGGQEIGALGAGGVQASTQLDKGAVAFIEEVVEAEAVLECCDRRRLLRHAIAISGWICLEDKHVWRNLGQILAARFQIAIRASRNLH